MRSIGMYYIDSATAEKQLKRQAASSNNNIDHAQNVENKVDSRCVVVDTYYAVLHRVLAFRVSGDI